MKKKITVQECAKLMEKDPQYVRVGLQRGILPFGTAIQVRGERYSYYISPKLFAEYVGMKEEEL